MFSNREEGKKYLGRRRVFGIEILGENGGERRDERYSVVDLSESVFYS